jgi:hypothetical protein
MYVSPHPSAVLNLLEEEQRLAVQFDANPGVVFTSFLSPALLVSPRVDGGLVFEV